MRQGSNSGRRPRGRTKRKQHGGGGGGQPRTNTFDSNGPDGRVRGNARQVYEKYLTLARDASSAGDRIAAEAYYQYAEHYFRILNDSTDPQSQRRNEERQPHFNGNGDVYGHDDDQSSEPNGSAFQEDEQATQGHGNGPAVTPDAQPESARTGEAEAARDGQQADVAPRPRRARPRKPRTDDGGKAAKQEAATETEDGPPVV